MKRISLILLVGLLGGCSYAHSHKSVAKSIIKSSRCRTLDKKVGKYSSVMIRKDCLKVGQVEVVILLHAVARTSADRKMVVAKKGVEESTRMLVEMLGYRPKLSTMAITRVRSIPCYVFLILGAVH